MTDAPQHAAMRRPISRWAKVGTVLMIASLPLWPILLVVPLLPLGIAARGAAGIVIVVLAEIMFWSGAALAGPETARRIRSWWRRPRGT